MTRTFDSGLSAALPTMIRNGIITLLQPLTRAQGGFAVVVIPFPYVISGGEMRTDQDLDMLIAALGNRCPGYAVACGDISGRRAGAAGYYHGEMQVEVYCVTNHMRHIVEGRLSADVGAQQVDRLDPGVEVMREMARMFLTDQTPVVGGGTGFSVYGTKAKELQYSGERELVTLREHTLWGVQFTITVELDANMLRGATKRVTELFAKHRPGAGDIDAPAAPADPLVTTLTDIE